jgi:hypothetical protein
MSVIRIFECECGSVEIAQDRNWVCQVCGVGSMKKVRKSFTHKHMSSRGLKINSIGSIQDPEMEDCTIYEEI